MTMAGFCFRNTITVPRTIVAFMFTQKNFVDSVLGATSIRVRLNLFLYMSVDLQNVNKT